MICKNYNKIYSIDNTFAVIDCKNLKLGDVLVGKTEIKLRERMVSNYCSISLCTFTGNNYEVQVEHNVYARASEILDALEGKHIVNKKIFIASEEGPLIVATDNYATVIACIKTMQR